VPFAAPRYQALGHHRGSFNGTEHMPVRQIAGLKKELYEWRSACPKLSQEGDTDPVAVMTEIRKEMRTTPAPARFCIVHHIDIRGSRGTRFPVLGFIAKYAGLAAENPWQLSR